MKRDEWIKPDYIGDPIEATDFVPVRQMIGQGEPEFVAATIPFNQRGGRSKSVICEAGSGDCYSVSGEVMAGYRLVAACALPPNASPAPRERIAASVRQDLVISPSACLTNANNLRRLPPPPSDAVFVHFLGWPTC
jgi:hypothetical protein